METRTSVEGANDIDMLKKMEDEHCRLQRQVKMIQTDRLHRTMGVHPQFRRQDHLLRTLKKEYNNILLDLKMARSGAHKKNHRRMENNLQNALIYRTHTELECDESVIVMEQLEKVLQGNNQEMLRLKKLVNASKGQMQQRRMQSERRLVSTENKLEAAMLRFNAVQTENRKIRDEIEHMLKDRALFNQAWSQKMGVLSKGKKFLQDLFESSTLAYDQRDEWCYKLRTLQEKGKVDQSQQLQEMRYLQRIFDHEMKIYHFLARKGVMRVNKKQEKEDLQQQKREEEKQEKNYEAHVKILNEICDYTQETNVEKIIENFELTDQYNFSVYKLLTDFCAENEMLERSLRSIQRDIEERRDWNEVKENERQTKLENFRQQLEEKKKKTDQLRSMLNEKEESLKGTMEKVNEMFKMLNCSLDPFLSLLGDKEPSLNHLTLTLCLIADKIKENIEVVYFYERFVQKKDKTSTSRLKKYTANAQPWTPWTACPITDIVPADPCPSCIEARWMSRLSEATELPFDAAQARVALEALASEPAYLRSDRLHALAECRVPRSRAILARRYVNH